MSQKPTHNPILNNPYEEPLRHYFTLPDGSLDDSRIEAGRRPFLPDIPSLPMRRAAQGSIFSAAELATGEPLITLIRKEVFDWRRADYPHITCVSKELLSFWFLSPERVNRLFFAQREAVETTVWLNEVAEKSNAGANILSQLRTAQLGDLAKLDPPVKPDFILPRIAFKMATGSGKTVVMAMQILYHFFNRQEYRSDTRFVDSFLLIAPGITIKDRLGVLYVDAQSPDGKKSDYYHQRDLVPRSLEDRLENLNARLVILNRDAFRLRALSGNKRSPFDGKDGTPKSDSKEDYNRLFKRILGKFKPDSRVLVLNDEGHHCYLPLDLKTKTKSDGDENSKEENERAAIWISGIAELSKRFKLHSVYDLSATPYYINGSGYTPYTLFPWCVSDFNLVEAIESGLVKIPYLPEEVPSGSAIDFRNLFQQIKTDLVNIGKTDPVLPPLLKVALGHLYTHYEKEYNHLRSLGLFESPPVLIVVCRDKKVSAAVYKYLAGYEDDTDIDPSGNTRVVNGAFSLFDNYDQMRRSLRESPTLLIDTDALDSGDQITEDFKKVFSKKIDLFKQEYRRLHPERDADALSEADILREVTNTVGRPGKLGAHIRCVVSVSMLTEGWDANTVTHICGVRAFLSQLLCEQVVGRALRRMQYHLQPPDKDGIRKFSAEYAQIIGVPFRFFKGGKASDPTAPDTVFTIEPVKERDALELTFPNLIGYRQEPLDETLTADFSTVPDFIIDAKLLPPEIAMENAFSPQTETLSVSTRRKQTLLYFITNELIRRHFTDDDKAGKFYLFTRLRPIVDLWYESKVRVINALAIDTERSKQMLFHSNPQEVCQHICQGIPPLAQAATRVQPLFDRNPVGSTANVFGRTARPVVATLKSHINYVVADTDFWEQNAAAALEELPEVESYVKNAFLGFAIPYVQEGKHNPFYYPDFIACCRTPQSKSAATINLIIEITGMSQDKIQKRFYVQNFWLPAVNSVRDQYTDTFGKHEWHFLEITNAADSATVKSTILNHLSML